MRETRGQPQSPSYTMMAGFSLWRDRDQLIGRQVPGWRLAALASTTLCVVLATTLVTTRVHAGLQTRSVDAPSAATVGSVGFLSWATVHVSATAESSSHSVDNDAALARDRNAENRLRRR